MHRLLLTLLTVIVLSVFESKSIEVYNLTTGLKSEKNAVSKPSISIATSPSSYTISFRMSEIGVLEDFMNPGNFMLEIPDFIQTSAAGTPSLPIKGESLYVPYGKKLVVSTVNYKYKELNIKLTPSHPDVSTTELLNKLPIIQNYNGLYPTFQAFEAYKICYRGETFANIFVCPVAYSKSSNTARIYTNLTLQVDIVDATENEIEFKRPITLKQFEWNPIWYNSSYDFMAFEHQDFVEPSEAKDFLIITVPELEESAKTFVEWKKQEGYNCHILTDEDWGDDATKVKSEIDNFASSHPNFYAFMILGDYTKVPTNIKINSYAQRDDKKLYTDCPYACMDGTNDYQPDVLYGRIPVNTKDSVDNALSKIINYESQYCKTYVNKEYKPPVLKNIMLGQFRPYSDNLTEAHRFIESCEEIIDSTNNRILWNKIYYTSKACYPKYYADGRQIPYNLQKPNYDWANADSKLLSYINSNSINYVFYIGHGNPNGLDYDGSIDEGEYGRVVFQNQIIDQFNNKRWYPLIFFFACSTANMLTSNNLCKYLLTNSDESGAAGTFGATNVGYVYTDSHIATGIIRALYNNDTSINNSWLTVGEAINAGFSNLRNCKSNKMLCDYEQLVFHWYGDPTMYLLNREITNFHNISVSVDNFYTTIKSNDCEAQITFLYNDGSILTHRGNSATFKNQGCEKIVLTAPNKAPQIIYMDDLTTNSPSVIVGTSLNSVFYKGGYLTVNYNINILGVPSYLTSGQIVISSIDGQKIESHNVPVENSRATFDVSSLPRGTYTVSLIFNSQNYGSVSFIKS